MINKKNNNLELLNPSPPLSYESYSFSLCGLTLIIMKQNILPIEPTFSNIILSLENFKNQTILNLSNIDHNKIITFQFDKKNKNNNIINSQYLNNLNENHFIILHAPSLLALWALAAQKEAPNIIHDILPKPNFSNAFLFYLRIRLYYERFRLGADSESLFIKKILYRNAIGNKIPSIPIKQWIKWLDIIRKFK